MQSDSDNDSDQTLFPKFIVLELTEDTPITKLFLFIIEKTHNSLIKPKSVKKLNQQYPAGRSAKKNFSDLLLEQKYFHNLKIKAYPWQLPELVKGCSEKPRSLPLHFRWNKK